MTGVTVGGVGCVPVVFDGERGNCAEEYSPYAMFM